MIIFLRGPRMSGRSTLAEIICDSAIGRTVKIEAHELEHMFGFEKLIGADNLIVEGYSEKIYQLVEKEIEVDRMGKSKLRITVPGLIVVIVAEDRQIDSRFLVFELGQIKRPLIPMKKILLARGFRKWN